MEMTIKVKGIDIKKDARGIIGYESGKAIFKLGNPLEGKVKIKIENGVINANQELDVSNVSKKLQDELYEVLNKIEDELNGENLVTGDTEISSNTHADFIVKTANDQYNKGKIGVIETGDAEGHTYRYVEGNSPKEITINLTVNGDSFNSDKFAKELFDRIKKSGKLL